MGTLRLSALFFSKRAAASRICLAFQFLTMTKIRTLVIAFLFTGCLIAQTSQHPFPALDTTNIFTGPNRFADLSTKGFPVIDMRAYGAVGDLIAVRSVCSMTSGRTLLTCIGAAFTTADVGKSIAVQGAGGSGSFLNTTIAAYTGPTQVIITAPATTTIAKTKVWYGTDNYSAFCTAMDCANASAVNKYNNGVKTGREVYLAGGSYYISHPLYVRNNYSLRGAGNAATQIVLLNPNNSAPEPGTGAAIPVICANGNASAGVDTCTDDSQALGATGSTSISDVLVDSPENTTYGIYTTSNSGILLNHIWTETAIGIAAYHSNAIVIDGMVCDVGTAQCIVLIGDGRTDEYASGSFGATISNSQLFDPLYSCIWVDGMSDVLVDSTQCRTAHHYGLYVHSPEGYTTRRLTISNSHFTGASALQQKTYTHLWFHAPCVDCIVIGNTFSYAQSEDILLDSTGIVNLLVKGNIFANGGQASAKSSVYTNNTTKGNAVFEGNVWDSPGQYAIFSNMPMKLIGNTCNKPFSVSKPLGGGANDYENGCWYFTAGSAGTEARMNSTDSTTHPAVSFNASSVGTTSDNLSGYDGCAVCTNNNGTGLAATWNERSKNYGASGDGLFRSKFDPVAGIMMLPPTIYADLGATAPNGTVKYCSDCVSGSSCGNGGRGAFAKRLNGSWVCN